jgi:hypothetical protein
VAEADGEKNAEDRAVAGASSGDECGRSQLPV